MCEKCKRAFKAYDEAKAPAWEAYKEAIAPAEKAYEKIIASCKDNKRCPRCGK